MDAAEFKRVMDRAPNPETRLEWFGALLAKETGKRIEIVGGSAIEIYLSSELYVSQDVDVVGSRTAIDSVLHRWEYERVVGRSHRVYWASPLIGLVDIVGATDSSGLPPRRRSTPFGPVLLSAPEPLIIRRLVRSRREKSSGLFRQAVALARLGSLDWEYLASEARYEQIEDAVDRLRKRVK